LERGYFYLGKHGKLEKNLKKAVIKNQKKKEKRVKNHKKRPISTEKSLFLRLFNEKRYVSL